MISKVLIFVALYAVVYASHHEHHEHHHHHPQPYKFGYEIKDHHGSHHRHEHGDGHGHVQGSYGYTDHKGIHREVHYIFFLTLFCTIALASHDDHEEHQHPQPYKFGYEIKDDHGSQHRQEHGDGHGYVQGSYGYTDHKGIHREVHYEADHQGFRATVKTNEPGTDNQDPANVNFHSNAHHALHHDEHDEDE
ncbi:cuticle protein 16.8 [Nephila pilipes]|uniref:Cuticle protein 16.8 n=1 Tax=Nephila pilipes TaxID=299642 RepID=A0A8X6I7J1_NEPPI|nr:cuticle protein 16.8 [Nephila pilipes]